MFATEEKRLQDNAIIDAQHKKKSQPPANLATIKNLDLVLDNIFDQGPMDFSDLLNIKITSTDEKTNVLITDPDEVISYELKITDTDFIQSVEINSDKNPLEVDEKTIELNRLPRSVLGYDVTKQISDDLDVKGSESGYYSVNYIINTRNSIEQIQSARPMIIVDASGSNTNFSGFRSYAEKIYGALEDNVQKIKYGGDKINFRGSGDIRAQCSIGFFGIVEHETLPLGSAMDKYSISKDDLDILDNAGYGNGSIKREIGDTDVHLIIDPTTDPNKQKRVIVLRDQDVGDVEGIKNGSIKPFVMHDLVYYQSASLLSSVSRAKEQGLGGGTLGAATLENFLSTLEEGQTTSISVLYDGKRFEQNASGRGVPEFSSAQDMANSFADITNTCTKKGVEAHVFVINSSIANDEKKVLGQFANTTQGNLYQRDLDQLYVFDESLKAAGNKGIIFNPAEVPPSIVNNKIKFRLKNPTIMKISAEDYTQSSNAIGVVSDPKLKVSGSYAKFDHDGDLPNTLEISINIRASRGAKSSIKKGAKSRVLYPYLDVSASADDYKHVIKRNQDKLMDSDEFLSVAKPTLLGDAADGHSDSYSHVFSNLREKLSDPQQAEQYMGSVVWIDMDSGDDKYIIEQAEEDLKFLKENDIKVFVSYRASEYQMENYLNVKSTYDSLQYICDETGGGIFLNRGYDENLAQKIVEKVGDDLLIFESGSSAKSDGQGQMTLRVGR